MRRTIKRAAALAMVLLLAALHCIAAFAQEGEVSLDESHVDWDDSSAYFYNLNGERHAYRDMYVGNSVAYCVDPDQNDFPHTMYDETSLGNSGSDLMIKALLLLGPGGKYYSQEGIEGISFWGKGSWYISSDASMRRVDQLLIHFSIAKAFHGSFSSKVSGALGGFLDEMMGKISEKLQDPSSVLRANALAARAYIGYHAVEYPTLQNLVWLESQPDTTVPGAVSVRKKSSAEVCGVIDNANYSLQGAEFAVYADPGLTNQVALLVTDENGESGEVGNLEPGTYYMKELKASKGYKPYDGVVPVSIGNGEKKQVVINEPVEGDPIGIQLIKTDSGNAAIESNETEFTAIYTYPGNDGEEKIRTFVYHTDEQGKVNLSDAAYLVTEKSDEPYIDEFGTIQFFAGHISVRESKAPNGYYIDYEKEISFDLTVDEAGEIHMVVNPTNCTFEQSAVYISNDRAVDTFAYDSVTKTQTASYGNNVVIEDLVILRGAKGLDVKITGYPVFGQDYIDAEGVQYYAGESFPFNEQESLTEIYAFAENDYEEFVLKYEIDTTRFPGARVCLFARAEYGEDYCVHQELEDEDEIITICSIETKARDTLTGSHMGSMENAAEDTVQLLGLQEGLQYEIVGYAIDVESGEVVGEKAVKEFTASDSEEQLELKFDISGEQLKGKTIVFCEELYYQENLVAGHYDLENEAQRIHFPEIKTELTVKGKTDHIAVREGKAEFTDTVEYDGLELGRAYIIKGVLVDKSTGNALKDEAGNEVATEKEFTAEKTSGKIQVDFMINKADTMPTEIVCFEYLYLKDENVLLASHEDINDKNQTITIQDPPKKEEPPKDKPGVKTGEKTDVYKWVLLLIGAILVIGAAAVIKKKEAMEKKK